MAPLNDHLKSPAPTAGPSGADHGRVDEMFAELIRLTRETDRRLEELNRPTGPLGWLFGVVTSTS